MRRVLSLAPVVLLSGATAAIAVLTDYPEL